MHHTHFDFKEDCSPVATVCRVVGQLAAAHHPNGIFGLFPLGQFTHRALWPTVNEQLQVSTLGVVNEGCVCKMGCVEHCVVPVALVRFVFVQFVQWKGKMSNERAVGLNR